MSTNLKFIIRRLLRHKTHTIPLVLGLTLGIATCLTISLFLAYEVSFDDYHGKSDRIYRVNQVWEAASYGIEYHYTAPAPLAAALRENIPGLETVASVFPQESQTIEVRQGKLFNQEGILFAESDFLNVFDIEIIEGDAYAALRQPWQTILSESTAQKFFGGENPIGKTILYDGEKTLTVAGVMKDLPDNTHLPASMLISYLMDSDYLGINMNSWGFVFGASTYVVLNEDANPEDVQRSIRTVYDKYANTDPGDPEISRAELQSLANIHLEPRYEDGGSWVKAINPRWLWFFGAISLIVLLLACVNFINLSTAQSMNRAREVAVRKTVGATRGQLIRQLLGEALVLISVATILGIIISNLAVPYLNESLDKEISFKYILNVKWLSIFLVSLSLIAVLTGIYPARLISKFQPAISLKGKLAHTNKGSNLLQKALVTIQFTVSGATLIGLFFIARQLEFFYTQSMGFDQDNIVLLEAPDRSKFGLFVKELEQIEAVKSTSFMGGPPSQLQHNGTEMQNYGDPNPYSVEMIAGDDQYAEVFDLQLKAGRYPSVGDTSASSFSLPRDQRFPKVLVNEHLVQVMGFGTPEEAIGKRFKVGWNGWQPEIVGVVENFVTNSLHDPIQSVVIFQQSGFYDQVCVKISGDGNMAQTLAGIQSAWQKAFPKYFYDYEFIDSRIEAYYKSESQLFWLFKIFTGLAILISCLGLWGLATHSAVQRTKEIGIRKVLGASIPSIVKMVSLDFLKPVGLAVFLSILPAWYLTQQWLQGFAHRIDLNWKVFAFVGILVVTVALLTISVQSVRAALVNPVDSIRKE